MAKTIRTKTRAAGGRLMTDAHKAVTLYSAELAALRDEVTRLRAENAHWQAVQTELDYFAREEAKTLYRDQIIAAEADADYLRAENAALKARLAPVEALARGMGRAAQREETTDDRRTD